VWTQGIYQRRLLLAFRIIGNVTHNPQGRLSREIASRSRRANFFAVLAVRRIAFLTMMGHIHGQ
jgi:hypothetical protein